MVLEIKSKIGVLDQDETEMLFVKLNIHDLFFEIKLTFLIYRLYVARVDKLKFKNRYGLMSCYTLPCHLHRFLISSSRLVNFVTPRLHPKRLVNHSRNSWHLWSSLSRTTFCNCSINYEKLNVVYIYAIQLKFFE